MFILVDRWILILRNMGEDKLFLWNQRINIIYPNEENMFMVPNHNNNEDYYENPCLPYLTVKFDSKKNGRKKIFSCKTKTSTSYILIRWTCLWWPITEEMKIIMSIHVYLIWWINFDFKENGRRKSFSCKAKASILFMLVGQ